MPGFLQNFLELFSDHPWILSVQVALVLLGLTVFFLVLFATRDILERSDSFFVQLLCILLVAGLPILGFFLYLLLRPSTTVRERRLEQDLGSVLQKLATLEQPRKSEKRRAQAPASA